MISVSCLLHVCSLAHAGTIPLRPARLIHDVSGEKGPLDFTPLQPSPGFPHRLHHQRLLVCRAVSLPTRLMKECPPIIPNPRMVYESNPLSPPPLDAERISVPAHSTPPHFTPAPSLNPECRSVDATSTVSSGATIHLIGTPVSLATMLHKPSTLTLNLRP